MKNKPYFIDKPYFIIDKPYSSIFFNFDSK